MAPFTITFILFLMACMTPDVSSCTSVSCNHSINATGVENVPVFFPLVSLARRLAHGRGLVNMREMSLGMNHVTLVTLKDHGLPIFWPGQGDACPGGPVLWALPKAHQSHTQGATGGR